MQVSWIQADARLDMRRGQVIVCIPVFAGHDYFVACLTSVLAHTSADVPILICDDASPDPRSAQFVAELAGNSKAPHKLIYLRRVRNLGFPENVNGAFTITAPADVIVLNSDCEVADGWLEGLTDAAGVDSRVATATALSNHGTVVSVPLRSGPSPTLPAGWTLDAAAEAVRSASLRIRPRLPTAIGHCMYIRRAALELVGDFDPAFTPGYGEEVDFSQRCLQAGLAHVLADDVLVLHHGGASLSVNGRPNPVQAEHERLIDQRYPYYHRAINNIHSDHVGPLARALGVARRALCGTSVVIDARVLDGPMTGTQLQVLEVIAALARTGQVHLTVITPDRPAESVTQTLTALRDVQLVRSETVVRNGLPRADLVHRPYQIASLSDIAFLAPLGERLVITNQDLISFDNPSYFRDAEAWETYRHTTQAALAVADKVVFISAHSRDGAIAEHLVEEHRASVVHNGVDHTVLEAARADPAPPAGCDRLPADAEAILCLGTDFRHKNRLFALRLLAELRQKHNWTGYLVLAGPHVHHGSSAADEAAWLEEHPETAKAVLGLPAVSDAGKKWLYDRCSLVLYPTVYEGFGLVPFEAADHDRPCLWAPATALAEVLPPESAAIIPWSIELTAERAIEILRSERARRENVEAIRSASRALTWDRAASDLLRIYGEACDAPATPASAVERRQGLMQGLLSQDAIRLIGPDGLLPRDLERPLLALATHPRFARPMFRAIRLGYGVGHTWRRRLRLTPDGEGGPDEAS